jgi:uncharacterized protein involved in exopolysaccharide biosynthesis
MESPQQLISAMRLRLDSTQARLSEVQQNIAVMEWESEQNVTDSQHNEPVDSKVQIEKQPKYHEDLEWRQLDRKVRTAQHSIESSDLEPNNPELIRASKDVKFAVELLRQREAQLDELWHDRQENAESSVSEVTAVVSPEHQEGMTSRQFRLARAKQEEKLIVAELKKLQADFHNLFADAQTLENENNKLQHKRQLFKAVQQRLDQKNMESVVPGPIEVLTPAFAPSEPHKDHRILFTAIVLLLDGIGMAISGWLLHRQGFL